MNTSPHSTSTQSQRRGAFTLVELLVVVVIALILLTISVPAFQSLIDSSERSLAVNTLQSAVQAAQDIALDGREGEDGAIMFLVDDSGRMTMVPAVKIGTMRDPYAAAPGGLGFQSFDYNYIEIDVFAPLKSGDSIQLPDSWFVRGYAPVGSMIDDFVPFGATATTSAAIWYNSAIYGGLDVNSPIKAEGHWVFPETNLYAKDAQHVGGNATTGELGTLSAQFHSPRQSFMVRFDARTGQLSRSTDPAVFIDPRQSRKRPFGATPQAQERWKRLDLADSYKRWGIRMLTASDTNSDGTHWTISDQYTRSMYIGNISNDTVLVKAVTRLALYDEHELAGDLGARSLNSITGTLYKDYDQTDSNAEIEFDLDLWVDNPPTPDQLRVAIDRWMDGDTAGPRVNDRPWPDGEILFDADPPPRLEEVDVPRSRLYLIQPYSGRLQEVLR